MTQAAKMALNAQQSGNQPFQRFVLIPMGPQIRSPVLLTLIILRVLESIDIHMLICTQICHYEIET